MTEHVPEDHCKSALGELEAELQKTKEQLDDLKIEVRVSQGNRVAFGANLGNVGTVGPFNTDITLVYKNVYANTGSYNPGTGIFTAPVKGVYYFSFSGHNHSTKPMGLSLMKNGVQTVTAFNHPAGNRPETATNGMTLQLEEGDQVYIKLWANTWLFDNENSHGTFIGHLLLPLVAEAVLEDHCKSAFGELEAKLQKIEEKLDDLKKVQGNRVAFGANLGNVGTVGPFNTDITLVYKNVYANTGSYNPGTGIFTAPVKGVYYFSFSGHNHSTKPMGLSLMKNGGQTVTAFNHPAGDRPETATNGMTLQLEEGDQVYIKLWADTWLFDNENSHGTFIGHLLLPL